MAESVAFAQLVKDVIGEDGLKLACHKTGISTAYINKMQRGHVPSAATIGDFAGGYDLDQETTKALFDAAKELCEDVKPERLIHVACDAEGLTAMERLKVLNYFRQVKSDSDKEHSQDTAA